MRLRYTLPALADLDDILAHIAPQSPKGAVHVQARIKAITDLLLTYPRIGAMTQDPAIRRMTTSPYPYLIFYEVADAEVITTRCAMAHAIPQECRDRSDCMP